MPATSREPEVVIRPLVRADLAEADHVMRLAFGTFLGIPEPSSFMGDASFVVPRWNADPSAAFVAEIDGRIVGSNFAARWGSFAFLGPITTRPDVWDRGIGSLLMEPIIDLFAQWEVRLAGLFTFPQSAKHLGLYQKYGFSPRFLTAVMAKTVDASSPVLPVTRISATSGSERDAALAACRAVTDAVFEGLDLTNEIESIDKQKLGDTILLWSGAELAGFAAIHQGPGTEAGSGTCYVKFGAARPGPEQANRFDDLVTGCLEYAGTVKAVRLIVGVNTSRREAHERLVSHGFHSEMFGIAMHRPSAPGFSRDGVFVLDDWR